MLQGAAERVARPRRAGSRPEALESGSQGEAVDTPSVLGGLEGDRRLAEHELAVGDWARARRVAGRALEALDGWLRRTEPELWGWLRILGTLAEIEVDGRHAAQLPLWPDLDGGRGACRTGEGDRRPLEPGALGVITRDERMRAVLAFLDAVAPTPLPVLLEGETGCGKEVVARAIHTLSGRPGRGFVAVNCGAIPIDLQESELFGHSRGAYTGALTDKQGLFEAAHEGTLFLDEIGEMDGRSQVKLLRVLETGEIRRLGEVRTRTVDVRVVAATNADIDRGIEQGRFRRDLLFRLGAVRVRLPPLRERPGDILPLAVHFLRKAAVRLPALTPGAERALLRHDWPGNVRELKFVIERAAALWRRSASARLGEELLLLHGSGEEALIRGAPASGRTAPRGAQDGPEARGARERCAGVAPSRIADAEGAGAGGGESAGVVAASAPRGGNRCPAAGAPGFAAGGDACAGGDAALPAEVPEGESLESFLETIERRLIGIAIERSGGNRTLAARLLGGVSRTTLIGKMRRLGVAASGSGTGPGSGS